MKRKLKANTILLILGSFIGLSLLLYPYFSDFWNRNFTTHVIESYTSNVESMNAAAYQQCWEQAVEYNRTLINRSDPYHLSPEQEAVYDDILRVEGDNGVIGFLEIPKIDVTLPIYHGVSDAVLQDAVGHLPWTSVPTGGKGTHCVLSGHRGLRTAKLFTDLDLLREGDYFMIRVMNELMTYEVDQIRVVEPGDASDLLIDPNEDYCTLFTCTPYGVNTHRLLVRGRRISNFMTVNVVSEAVLIDRLLVGLCLAGMVVFILILYIMLKKPKPKKKPIRPEDIRQTLESRDRKKSSKNSNRKGGAS